ncbi:MAG TPA: ATP-binding protein [Ktedonobacteraceae bacterium]|nr:ATP-binding protein [Ktedonobacteraceae bacterium]
MIFTKPLNALQEEDLQTLIESQTPEGKSVEYKRELPGGTDSDKKEFLADVSSFANAQGGYLFYGMEEAAGVPQRISGLQLENADEKKLQLENLIRDGLDPRLPRIDLYTISLSGRENTWVLLIHVQRSWLAPHRVMFKDHGHFYSRNSAGKYRLDVSELRTAFELAGTAAERIRNFRADRLGRIVAGDTPQILPEGAPRLALHLIPFLAFDPAQRFDPHALTYDSTGGPPLLRTLSFEPIELFQERHSATQVRVNFDGLLCFRPNAEYVQIFRNGCIEAVNASIAAESTAQHVIPGVPLERGFLQIAKRSLSIQQKLGVEPPVFVMASLLGVGGYTINPYVGTVQSVGEPIDRADLLVTESIVDSFELDYHRVMRPIFDSIWNAVGFDESPFYDENGRPTITRF